MRYLLLLLLPLLSLYATAQNCTPTSNCQSGDYIHNFEFAGISNLETEGTNCVTGSYVNTGLTGTVDRGNAYNISVQAGENWGQGLGVWIDLNNDGDFDASEFVFSNSAASTDLETGSVFIPSDAYLGTVLMRVRSKYGATISATESCTDFNFGETEDYYLTIQTGTAPPVANFVANATTSCSGDISFTDQSTSTPTSWSWNFGDGGTSTSQNPQHTYSANGTYTVSLQATNAFGSHTEIKTDYITINSTGATPVANTCYPATLNHTAGFGITFFQLNTISNASADGSAGYEDFTCGATTVQAGGRYPIKITADNPSAHNAKVWIDWNNDGSFNASSEEVVSVSGFTVYEDSIDIPANVALNTPLRVRVSADWWMLAAPEPCVDLERGQCEDYSIIVEENVTPPVASFTSDIQVTCDGTVQFTDLSQNAPTSWLWDFGDGNTSAQQNPSHTYALTDGLYTVTLIATNDHGPDTFVLDSAVLVRGSGPLVPSTCTPITQANCCDYGIYGVRFRNINNSSGGGEEGYQDYSCEYQATVNEHERIEIEIRTGPDNSEDVVVWLDINNDGAFDASEIVMESFNRMVHYGEFCVPEVSTSQAIRMRIASDGAGNVIDGCGGVLWGQVEDYGLFIYDAVGGPALSIRSNVKQTCDGYVEFTDMSCGSPTSWFWEFGDGATSTEQHPTHDYDSPGIFSITLTATNALGTTTTTFDNFIEVTTLFGAPVEPTCKPNTISHCCGIGINRVIFLNIDQYSEDGEAGYEDFTCADQAIVAAGQTHPISIYWGQEYEQDVSVWVDFNNNGDFSWGEMVHSATFEADMSQGSISIPSSGVVYDTPLRMRISADYVTGGINSACTEPQLGQVEDYTMIVQNPNAPPVANFTVDSTYTCAGTVQFENNSSSTAQDYVWDFGDGSTSTAQHPSHTYATEGTYDVELTATNGNGSNSLLQTNYVTYNSACAISVQNLNTKKTFKLFPNPTSGTFTVMTDSPGNLIITNNLGQVVHQQLIQQESIVDLHLDAGIYFSLLHGEVKKLIIK